MSTPLKQSAVTKPISYRIGDKEKKTIIKKWGTMSNFFNEKVKKELAIIAREELRKKEKRSKIK